MSNDNDSSGVESLTSTAAARGGHESVPGGGAGGAGEYSSDGRSGKRLPKYVLTKAKGEQAMCQPNRVCQKFCV